MNIFLKHTVDYAKAKYIFYIHKQTIMLEIMYFTKMHGYANGGKILILIFGSKSNYKHNSLLRRKLVLFSVYIILVLGGFFKSRKRI